MLIFVIKYGLFQIVWQIEAQVQHMFKIGIIIILEE